MVNKLHCSTQNRLNELKTLLDDKKAQIKSLMEKTSDVRRMKEGLQNNLLLEEEIKLKPVIAFDCGMGFHPDTPLNEYKQFSVCWLFRLATEKKLELVQTAKKCVSPSDDAINDIFNSANCTPAGILKWSMQLTRIINVFSYLNRLVEKEAEEKKKETYSKFVFEDYMKLCVCQTFEGRQGVKWVIKVDKDAMIKFCCLQSKAAEPYLLFCGVNKEDVQKRMLFVEGPEGYFEGSTAALKVASYLPFPYSAISALLLVPAPIRDAAYDYIAKRIYDWFGKADECIVMKEREFLERFIDRDEMMRGGRNDF